MTKRKREATKRERQLDDRFAWKLDDIFQTQVSIILNMAKNSLKKIRESLLMSKSELAREANVSPITISRIEQGMPCRMETKRKILLALGYGLSDAKKIFNE
jgi:DNA-binding XRE family transcriptional regulator